MSTYQFSVDAELLRELGERLVGRPHIALAELIKNSYDADASLVVVDFSGNSITVTDDGHGMSEGDFVNRWLRIGTTHKREEQTSPSEKRVLTGSKGVGRLAAQLLGSQIEIETTGLRDHATPTGRLVDPILAQIDWRAATQAGDLTDVSVEVRRPDIQPRYAKGSAHGTTVRITSLNDEWDADQFRSLAEEIWALQPPHEGDVSFRVELKSPYKDVTRAFDEQMRAILDIWVARVEGRLLSSEAPDDPTAMLLPTKLPSAQEEDLINEDSSEPEEGHEPLNADAGVSRSARAAEMRSMLPTRYLEVTVYLRDGPSRTVKWRIDNCEVDSLSYDFRVFEFRYRQPRGVRVGVARDYMSRFGGIAIFDSGFRLPYYGAEHDWLMVAHDFASRTVASKLVPKALAVQRGLLQLPRNEQLYGRVEISTNHEFRVREEMGFDDVPGLSIQVTRDRLVDNSAYEQIRVMTRAAVDLYAMEKARDEFKNLTPTRATSWDPPEPVSRSLRELHTVLKDIEPSIPKPVFEVLETAVDEAETRAKENESSARAYASVLGALATAGMTSLAYEHEMSKQVQTITSLARRLKRLVPKLSAEAHDDVEAASKEMLDWADRARRIRQVFKPLITRETRERVERLRARATLRSVIAQAQALIDGADVDITDVPEDLRLPEATYPAWSSIFQNIFVNSLNAMIDTSEPLMKVSGGGSDQAGWIEFYDNGVGVDLGSSESLWEPFERRLSLPSAREDAGLGGMGLGLTIVRMVSDEIGVRVRFVKPPEEFSTAVRIDWRGM